MKSRLHARYFTETSGGVTNPTEMVSMLICAQDSFAAGIHYAQEVIKGSCTMLLLTDNGSTQPA